jgi:hypothetical protein
MGPLPLRSADGKVHQTGNVSVTIGTPTRPDKIRTLSHDPAACPMSDSRIGTSVVASTLRCLS